MKLIKRQSVDGMFYFKLVDKNGRIIMKSKTFSSHWGVNLEIRTVQNILSKEVIFEDKTKKL